MKNFRALVVEDDQEKANSIKSEIAQFFGGDIEVTICRNLSASVREILTTKYDFIVIDLMLPSRDGDTPTDFSNEIIEHISQSEFNQYTTVVAISKFRQVIDERRSIFARSAIHLICYDDEVEWKSCLKICMQRVVFDLAYDFVIVCALEKERTAYEAIKDDHFKYGDPFIRDGLDCRELSYDGLTGVCVKLPRMGLVDASIIAAKALHAFKPKLIAMSGICGGFSGQYELGHLIVSDITWEHQAGKWNGDDFEIRTYQEKLSNDVQTVLSQMLEEDPNLNSLASAQHEIQMPNQGVSMGPTASGSSVIASKSHSDKIKDQHPKVVAIDMEVFGIYRAAAIYGEPVHFFAAKTVVDFSDEAKEKTLQQAGSILSARFTVKAIARIFELLDS